MANYSPYISLDQVTADYMKKFYLMGFKLMQDESTEISDEVYEEHIANAFAKLEQMLHVVVLERVIVGETHDYHVQDYANYGFLSLHCLPAQVVTEVRAVWPTGVTVQLFPSDWIKLERDHAQVNLVPTRGTFAQVVAMTGSNWVPLMTFDVAYLPQLWQVDYVAGFPRDKIPRILIEAVMKLAAVELLQIMADTIAPLGMQSTSLSVDGLSQSKSYLVPAFKARIDAYRKDLGLDDPNYTTGLLGQIRKTYVGIPWVSA